MDEYIIMTDSSCDLPAATAEELELVVAPLTVEIEGKRYVNYLDERDISNHEFYEKLRQKRTATTAAANMAMFMELFEEYLAKGLDVLYIGFSSALSGTYSMSVAAAEELRLRYPQRKIFTVDSLCASMGQGLLVYLTAMEKRKGGKIDEVKAYAESTKLRVCHWFTVDDLFHLKRGGRLSATSAVCGTVLNIKPVLHVDNEGRLVNVSMKRGRNQAIKRLAEKVIETSQNLPEQTVFISHGDCMEDVETLVSLITAAGVKKTLVSYVGPVIGAHSGPGTLAVFFTGPVR